MLSTEIRLSFYRLKDCDSFQISHIEFGLQEFQSRTQTLLISITVEHEKILVLECVIVEIIIRSRKKNFNQTNLQNLGNLLKYYFY